MLISKFGNYNNQLQELEEKNHLSLDDDYVRFLRKYNGGDTPKTIVKVGRKKESVRAFYGFGVEKEMYSLDMILEFEIVEDLLEKKLFPIASNEFGDFYVLDCSSEKTGVYVVRHDDQDNAIKIADSFREFVGACKSEKIGHIRTIEERKADMIAAGLGDKISDISIRNWQKEIDRNAGYHQEEIEF